MFACKPHWFALPKKFRDAIWSEYREGQEDRKDPSYRYMAVQTAARARLAFSQREPAQAWGLVLDANGYRSTAVHRLEGDPFALLPWPWESLEVFPREKLRPGGGYDPDYALLLEEPRGLFA